MISYKTLTQFEELLASGMTIRQATNSLCFSIKAIREAYMEHGRDWPTSSKLSTGELCVKIQEQLKQGLMQREISSSLKVSQPYISHLIRKFDLDKITVTTYKNQLNQACEQAISYVMRNGGSVANAISTLGLEVHPQTVQKRAVVQGINLVRYRYKSNRYGSWEIVEGNPTAIYTSDYLVTALCHGCNSSHCVSLVNLKSGASTQCKDCARSGVKFRKVLNTETGKQYRSIRYFAKEVGCIAKYQKIRKQLVKDGEILIDGTTYALVK